MPKILLMQRNDATVATPGTPVQLLDSTNPNRYVSEFTVYAPESNAGDVYIGSDIVDNTWPPLAPGSRVTYTAVLEEGVQCVQYDLSSVYVDADNAADSITFTYNIFHRVAD